MGKYRRKPEIVEARQFIGDNAEKLVGWDSDNIIISSDGIVCQVFISASWRWVIVAVGDWIILKDGRYSVCEEDKFAEEYEKESLPTDVDFQFLLRSMIDMWNIPCSSSSFVEPCCELATTLDGKKLNVEIMITHIDGKQVGRMLRTKESPDNKLDAMREEYREKYGTELSDLTVDCKADVLRARVLEGMDFQHLSRSVTVKAVKECVLNTLDPIIKEVARLSTKVDK